MLELMLAALLAGAVPQGAMTIKVGDLQVEMESANAWNISTLSFGGKKLILPSGGRGAAISVGGQWYGGGMRADSESVSALKIVADGKEVALEPLPPTVTGDKVTVSKESVLASLKHTAETSFEKDLFLQRHVFEATEDCSTGSFYAFIYSMWPQAKNWLARPLRGNLQRGEFNADGGNKPGTPVRWLAQYDPALTTGMVAYSIEPFAGPGAYHAFWDKDSYHKLLAQPLKGAITKGTKLEFTMAMQFFATTPGDWEQKAQEVAKALQTRIPPKELTGPDAGYAEGIPEDGLLTLKTAHYTVPMSAKQAWTIQRLLFDGNVIAHERGFYGTVLIPVGSNWWGTGHTEGGREIVKALQLLVDGKEQPIEMDKEVSGQKLTLVKDSVIWKLKCHSEVEVTDDFIRERTQLEALEDIELKLLYYFMHCFVPSTTKWAAELPDGAFTEGALKSEGGFAVNQDTRWVAQFEPNWQYGLLCYTPQVVSGPGSGAKIWDLDATRYHKFYYQANGPRQFKQGDKLDYTVLVKVVPQETGDWAATKAAASALKQLVPPQ
ncbi:MAG: hypothetical protein KKI08_20905 [Armatimonadetes bacterium]|nr:hypothetical protein [Armatimonadota bacterium]